MGCPSNTDSPEIRATKEHELSAAFMQYLSSTGSVFGAWKEDQEEYKMLMASLLRCPIEPYLTSKITNGTLLELGWNLGA
jgi:hypothetical protein